MTRTSNHATKVGERKNKQNLCKTEKQQLYVDGKDVKLSVLTSLSKSTESRYFKAIESYQTKAEYLRIWSSHQKQHSEEKVMKDHFIFS